MIPRATVLTDEATRFCQWVVTMSYCYVMTLIIDNMTTVITVSIIKL